MKALALAALLLASPQVFAADGPGTYAISAQLQAADGSSQPMAGAKIDFEVRYERGSDYHPYRDRSAKTNAAGNAQINVPSSAWFPLPLPASFEMIDYICVTADDGVQYCNGMADLGQSRDLEPSFDTPASKTPKYTCTTEYTKAPDGTDPGAVSFRCAPKAPTSAD